MNFSQIRQKFPKFAILKIAVSQTNSELCELYKDHIESHNENITQSNFPNSGFDIFFPKEEIFEKTYATKMVNLSLIHISEPTRPY